MTDGLDRRIRDRLRQTDLPKAPESLRDELHRLTLQPVVPRVEWIGRRHNLPFIAAAIGAFVILAIAMIDLGSTHPSAAAPNGGPATSSSAGSSPSPLASTVDGLAVQTVGEVLRSRANGGLRDQPVAVGGYWSDGSVGHSCAPPALGENPGDLELYCVDGEWGITELNEPIIVIDRFGQETVAKGPHLTPWLSESLARVSQLFTLPVINGQRYPPVPIVVVGHFDDPRADQCRKTARQLCADRLVVDRIVSFDPAAVSTPAPTPPPTPFPSPGPSGLFGPDECSGNVDYAFVGWTTTDQLQLPFSREGHVWAMVTTKAVPLGEWIDDPEGSGHKFRWFGRRICIREEGDPIGATTFGWVPGSTYQLWDDGRKVAGEP
jgi:hypothetical protein